jgi:hypothetical protein
MRGVAVWVHRSAAFHLELADEFEIAAECRGFQLPRLIEPPDRDRTLVLG